MSRRTRLSHIIRYPIGELGNYSVVRYWSSRGLSAWMHADCCGQVKWFDAGKVAKADGACQYPEVAPSGTP